MNQIFHELIVYVEIDVVAPTFPAMFSVRKHG